MSEWVTLSDPGKDNERVTLIDPVENNELIILSDNVEAKVIYNQDASPEWAWKTAEQVDVTLLITNDLNTNDIAEMFETLNHQVLDKLLDSKDNHYDLNIQIKIDPKMFKLVELIPRIHTVFKDTIDYLKIILFKSSNDCNQYSWQLPYWDHKKMRQFVSTSTDEHGIRCTQLYQRDNVIPISWKLLLDTAFATNNWSNINLFCVMSRSDSIESIESIIKEVHDFFQEATVDPIKKNVFTTEKHCTFTIKDLDSGRQKVVSFMLAILENGQQFKVDYKAYLF